MKHLKVFENFNNNLYSIVNHIGIDKNRVGFSDYELSKLSEFCKILNSLSNIRIYKDTSRLSITGFSTDDLDILSFEDEWFMLIDFYAYPDSICYRCDTIEGVIQCLKDNYTKS